MMRLAEDVCQTPAEELCRGFELPGRLADGQSRYAVYSGVLSRLGRFRPVVPRIHSADRLTPNFE